MSLEVNCPTCNTVTKHSPTNPSRPFCSERCKLIDLGAWATEQYAIPVEDPDLKELDQDLEKDSP